MSTPFSGPSPAPKRDKRHGGAAQLRILCTTDIHMRLHGFDYITDRSGPTSGLAGLATLVAQARQEATATGSACLLVDNGDTVQGTPMGHYLAGHPVTKDHAVAGSLNALGYDALGVGNHDLDFGLPYLDAIAQHLDAPLVASTLTDHTSAGLLRTALLSCAIPGTDHVLQVAVVSALPRLTEVWNQHVLDGRATVAQADRVLPPLVAQLRADGADLVVLLAHMGITASAGPDLETATDLAQAAKPDVIMAGHTHQRFPSVDHENTKRIDNAAATLCGVPALMAGHHGSDLGVLDLNLAQDADGRWRVAGHTAALRVNTPETPAAPEIMRATQAAHDATRRHLSAPLGQTDRCLHNYFSLAAPTPTSALYAHAKLRQVTAGLADCQDAALPILAASAAHTAGGREGSDHYTMIPRGAVLRRHLAGLNPYQNYTVALRITGAELRAWLEHAATVYAPLGDPDAPQLLADPATPAFLFETVFGVTYTIDPTKPVGQRVKGLAHAGTPVAQDQRFILATNQFRAAGGGGYGPFSADQVAARFPVEMEHVLRSTLNAPKRDAWLTDRPWRLSADHPYRADLLTSPQAADFMDEISHLDPQIIGTEPTGFLRLRLTL